MRSLDRARWRPSRLPRADLWFHGASVGDMRALAPLVRALKGAHPELTHLVTAQTAHGRRMGRELFDAPVAAPPVDLGPWARRALTAVRPRAVILEYLELWPAWVRACARARVPVIVVDGRVSHRSLRFRALLRKTAARVDLFCARSERDAANARALGVRPEVVHVVGNGKHDGAVSPGPPSSALRRAVGAVDVVIGSLHPDEEAEALGALSQSGLRALVAPRYPERTPALLARARRLGRCARRRSEESPEGADWIVLDTIGELASAYALGRVALVAGSFGRRGGQNLVEAAAWGRPIVHGPHVDNVLEEAEALAGRGASCAVGWVEAFELVRRRLSDPGPDPRPALATLRGATATHVEAIRALLGRLS